MFRFFGKRDIVMGIVIYFTKRRKGAEIEWTLNRFLNSDDGVFDFWGNVVSPPEGATICQFPPKFLSYPDPNPEELRQARMAHLAEAGMIPGQGEDWDELLAQFFPEHW